MTGDRCNLCKKSEKFVDRILFHCARTKVLWMFPSSFFGQNWIFLVTRKNPLLE